MANKVYVSMQETKGLGDFLTDVSLATTGNALDQVADMVNWWLRISTPVEQRAIQVRSVGAAFVAGTPVAGQGLVSVPTPRSYAVFACGWKTETSHRVNPNHTGWNDWNNYLDTATLKLHGDKTQSIQREGYTKSKKWNLTA